MMRVWQFVFTVFLLLLLPKNVAAQVGGSWETCSNNGIATLRCIPIFLGNLINSLFLFAGAVGVIFIIISGIQFLTSQGDQMKVAKARKTFTYAIIGLVIIILSFSIINFIAYATGSNCIKSLGFGPECV